MNEFCFGAGGKLRITYNPRECRLLIKNGENTFEFSEEPPYFEANLFGRSHFIQLTAAKRIHIEEYKTAVSEEVRAVYDAFFVGTRRLPLCIDTVIRADSETGKVVFEAEIRGDEEGSVISLHWPQPVRFNDNDATAYTVIPMMQGALIPSKWHNTVLINDGRYYHHDGYMPWFGQRWNSRGYLMTAVTADDAGYDFNHTPRLKTRIGNVWYPSLGKMRYRRICEMTLFGKCDYNDFCRTYREYIIENGKFVFLKEKAERNPTLKKRIGLPIIQDYVYVSTSPTSVRYSEEHPEWNRYFVPFEERSKQLKRLSNLGLTRAYFHLDGFGKNGYDNGHPDIFPPHKDVGGAPGLKCFIETCHELGFQIDLHDQYRDFYRNAPSFNSYQAIQDRDNNLPGARDCYGGDQNYLCARFALQYVRRNYRLLEKSGIRPDGVHLASFAGCDIDECYSPAHRMTRTDCIAQRKAVLSYLQSRGYLTCSDEPIDCMIGSLDTVIHAPYSLTPIEWDGMCNGIPVPLFSLIYHDAIIVPWFGNRRQRGGWGIPNSDSALDHAVLNASPPGIETDASADEIKKALNCCNIAEKLAFVPMTKHEFLSDDARIQRTRFADGTEIEVDFDKNESRIK